MTATNDGGGFRHGLAIGFVVGWLFCAALVHLDVLDIGFGKANTTIVSENPIYTEWVAASKVPTSNVKVRVIDRECPPMPDMGGCAVIRSSGIRIFIEPLVPAPNLAQQREVFFHELGHVFDATTLQSRDRRSIRSLLGFGPGRWSSPTLEATPSEWFAGAARDCALGASGRFTTYGFGLGFDQVEPICTVMVRAEGLREAHRPTERQEATRG